MPEASLRRVADAIGEMAGEARNLAHEVRVDINERKRASRLTVALLAAVMVCLVLVGVVVVRQYVEIRQRSTAASEQRENQLRVATQIESCTTPGGECAQRGQQAQAEAIRQLVEASVLANRCSVEAGRDVSAFDACLARGGVHVSTGG